MNIDIVKRNCQITTKLNTFQILHGKAGEKNQHNSANTDPRHPWDKPHLPASLLTWQTVTQLLYSVIQLQSKSHSYRRKYSNKNDLRISQPLLCKYYRRCYDFSQFLVIRSRFAIFIDILSRLSIHVSQFHCMSYGQCILYEDCALESLIAGHLAS